MILLEGFGIKPYVYQDKRVFSVVQSLMRKARRRNPWSFLLGNSGKPVTLETLSLTKFSKHVFQEQGFAILGNLEPEKLRIRECAEFGNLDSMKRRSHEHAGARNLNC
jgi:hypothetical protein